MSTVDTPETHFMIFNRQGDVVSSSNDNSDNIHDLMVNIFNMMSTNHAHPNNKPTKPMMSSKVNHIINTCQLVPSDGNPCAICLIKGNDLKVMIGFFSNVVISFILHVYYNGVRGATPVQPVDRLCRLW